MSHIQEGFESRCCFCIYSLATPKQAIKDNHKTYLHPLWEKKHFYEGEEGGEKLSFYRVLWSLTSYPMGMIGYFVDTLLKVILLVGNSFVFLVSLVNCQYPKWRVQRGVILFDNLIAVAICVIGMLIPPLAYRLDHCAEEKMLRLAAKVV